ncbi:MAG: sugar phosphate isomerase/epimerase [Actinobacteria bacterium]|nr:sugar phosphate isomerase/epimerase [Actinomycetota bacterium]
MNVDLLSLASATAPAATRVEQIRNAAAAGFDGVGLRVDLDPPSPAELGEVAMALADTGLVLLDIEVVRIGTHDESATRAVIDAVMTLRPRHLLAVSDLADEPAAVELLGRLAAAVRPVGTTVVVEFMVFTQLATITDAMRVVEATGDETIGVLVDPLHLQRSGSAPSALDGIDRSRLPYLQLCDAPLTAPAGGIESLIDEARHARLLPGAGELPLTELLRRVPAVPLSVEVHDDAARRRHSPAELARLVGQHTRTWLAAADQPSSTG